MEFLDRIVLDNSVRDILTVATVIAIVLLFKKILSRYISSGLFFVIHNFWKTVERKQFVELIFKPMGWFVSITVALIALNRLNYPSVLDFKILKLPFNIILDKIGIGIWILSFIKLVLSVVSFIAYVLGKKALNTPDKSDDQLVPFFREFFKVIIWILGALLILKAVFNQNIGYILTSLSIVGAALALSARESLENLIASFIIFFDKPFFVGDTLKVNNVTGTVERIGLRSTRIRTADKTLVTVPNKQMVDSVVDNWSMRTGRRAELRLELDEKTSATHLSSFIEMARNNLEAKKTNGIESYSVFLSDFNKNGSTVFVEYVSAPVTLAEFNELKQIVNLALINAVNNSAINLAVSSSNLTIVNNDSEDVGVPKAKPIV